MQWSAQDRLLPFAPLLRPRQAGIMLAIFVLTITLFPFNYDDLLAMRMLPVLLLNLRNLLVARPSGSTSPSSTKPLPDG